MADWIDRTPEFIARRYDRLAPFYGHFEWLYLLPAFRVRRRAIDALELREGDCVFEVGCGSGKNFALLEREVGPRGRIYGVDLSRGMLRRANSLCARRGFENVELCCADAARFSLPRAPDAALFSFSYSVMPARQAVLERTWGALAPSGRLVVLDVTVGEGRGRSFWLRYGNWQSGLTLLGKPDTEPWRDLAALAGSVETQRISLSGMGAFVICAARKGATLAAQGR